MTHWQDAVEAAAKALLIEGKPTEQTLKRWNALNPLDRESYLDDAAAALKAALPVWIEGLPDIITVAPNEHYLITPGLQRALLKEATDD